MTKVDLDKLEKRVKSLPSVQNEALMDIIREMLSFFIVEFSRLWDNPYQFILKISKTSSILS